MAQGKGKRKGQKKVPRIAYRFISIFDRPIKTSSIALSVHKEYLIKTFLFIQGKYLYDISGDRFDEPVFGHL